MKSSLASSSDGTLWINSTSNQIINGALTRKWQYPCVQDIDCSLTSADSVSLTTSIILSCVFLVLTILLIMSLRCCYLKAARNDKAKVNFQKFEILIELFISEKRSKTENVGQDSKGRKWSSCGNNSSSWTTLQVLIK